MESMRHVMTTIKRSLLHARPQELGKIKIGGKGETRQKKGGTGTYQLPVKYNHFVVTTRARGSDGNFLKDNRIHAHPKVGKEPTELDGMLMYHEVEENFHSQMVQYVGHQQTVACDGEEMTDFRTGVCGRCPRADDGECDCKPYARLHLQLLSSPYTGGYHVFRTTSWETTNNIQTALEEIHGMFGTLFHAPVRLILYPAEDSYVEGGVEKTSHSYKVGLVLAMSLEEAGGLMVEASRTMYATREALRITAGDVLAHLDEADKADAEEIAGEFFEEVKGPPALGTGNGEPEQVPGNGARALPVRGEPMPAPEPAAPAPEPTAPAFDAEDARKRFFATLRDCLGISNNDGRKAWMVAHGLGDSIKPWKQADYDKAQELLVGPIRDDVHRLCGEQNVLLHDLALTVIGKETPDWAVDWVKLRDALTKEEGGDEDGEL